MEALNEAIAQLEAIEKLLDEAGIPLEDEARIFSLVDRVQWLIYRSNVDFHIVRDNSRVLAAQLLQIARNYHGDSYKIKLIKALRELRDCSLSEAKDKVEELFDFSAGIKKEPVIR